MALPIDSDTHSTSPAFGAKLKYRERSAPPDATEARGTLLNPILPSTATLVQPSQKGRCHTVLHKEEIPIQIHIASKLGFDRFLCVLLRISGGRTGGG